GFIGRRGGRSALGHGDARRAAFGVESLHAGGCSQCGGTSHEELFFFILRAHKINFCGLFFFFAAQLIVRFRISNARSKNFISKFSTSSMVQPSSTAISSKVIPSARHRRERCSFSVSCISEETEWRCGGRQCRQLPRNGRLNLLGHTTNCGIVPHT